MTDKELLVEYLNGNMNAFHTFYEKYKDSLYTFLKNRSEENAADLFQETFVRFIDALTKKEINKPKSYLFQIAMNLLRNRSRQAKIILLSPEYDVPDQETEEEDEFPVKEEELKLSLLKLAKEKPEFYDVLHLHIFEKMTFDQISDLKQQNRNTISSRYRYAIHYLRKLLQPGLELVKEV